MDKTFYKKCIQYEVYGNKKLNPISKIICKYFSNTANCIFLIRKMMYLYDKGMLNKIRALAIRKKLITKYAVHIYPSVKIGLGLYISHPCAIVINGKCEIGDNFAIWQGCTIGSKAEDSPAPKIGNNVKIYTNSIILGDITITDNVVIGANSLLNKDALVPGTYFGSPAKFFKTN